MFLLELICWEMQAALSLCMRSFCSGRGRSRKERRCKGHCCWVTRAPCCTLFLTVRQEKPTARREMPPRSLSRAHAALGFLTRMCIEPVCSWCRLRLNIPQGLDNKTPLLGSSFYRSYISTKLAIPVIDKILQGVAVRGAQISMGLNFAMPTARVFNFLMRSRRTYILFLRREPAESFCLSFASVSVLNLSAADISLSLTLKIIVDDFLLSLALVSHVCALVFLLRCTPLGTGY